MDTNAENYINRPEIEIAWADKAFKFAEAHEKLLHTVDFSKVAMTKMDDRIYDHFRRVFPNLSVDVITEDDLKSAASKELWRPFCNTYEHLVADFNVGTLLKSNWRNDYTEQNTMIVVRIQWYAIEISTNKKSFNQFK